MKAALKAFVAWKMTEEIGYQEKMLQNNPASPSDSLESLCQTCPSDPAALVPMEDAVECLDRLLHRILHTALRRIPHHTVPGGAQRAADSKRSLHAVPTTEFSTRSTAHAVPDPSPAALIPFPAQSPLQDAAASGVPTQLLLRWGDPGPAPPQPAPEDAGLLERRARELCFGLPAGSPAERAVLQGLRLRCQVRRPPRAPGVPAAGVSSGVF